MMKSRLGMNNLQKALKLLKNNKELQNRLQEDVFFNENSFDLSVIFFF